MANNSYSKRACLHSEEVFQDTTVKAFYDACNAVNPGLVILTQSSVRILTTYLTYFRTEKETPSVGPSLRTNIALLSQFVVQDYSGLAFNCSALSRALASAKFP